MKRFFPAAWLKMARHLIDNLAAAWDPRKYTDEYKDNRCGRSMPR